MADDPGRKQTQRLLPVILVAVLVAVLGALPALTPVALGAERAVTVATYDLEPFVMTHGDVKAGFTIDLLDQIAKRNGWTLDYVDGGTVQGIMGAVADGRADIAACNISITADREKRFDFSQPIIAAGLQIIVRADEAEHSQAGLLGFLKLLFSKTILLWFLAALVLAVIPAHIIWLTERGHADSAVSRRYFPGIFQSFAWGLGILTAQPDSAPRHWVNRVLALALAFVSIVFVAYYTANLTSNLTVAKINSTISKPTDLIGKSVCTVADTTSPVNLKKLGVPFTGLPKIEDCYDGIEHDRFDAIVFDAPVLQYYVAHRGAAVAVMAGPVFKAEDYGIVFPLESDLNKDVDRTLLAIQEDGEYDLLRRKWFGP